MKKYIKYVIVSVVAVVLAVVYALSNHVFAQDDPKEMLKILCDAFFVPGVIITGFGGLVVASNGGTFDMLSYGMQRFFGLFQKDVTKVKYRTFREYRASREEKDRSFWYLLIVGVVCLLVAVVCLLLYNRY